MTISSIYPTTRPSLTLDFAKSKQVDPIVTFTRASTGTYIDQTGVLKTALVNRPRITHDSETGKCLGLLVEEARTNLLLNSATLSTQSVTVAATAHTLSFTGTGTVTLSGTSTAGPLVGTGAGEINRVALTFTPTAGTLTLTVSGTVSNAQLEAGSFNTSYIPTAGTAATRAADIATITGTSFSQWYRQDEGTVFSQSSVIAPDVQSQTVWSLTGGTYVTSLRQPQSTGDKFRAQIGNTFTLIPGTGAALSSGTTKACVAYSGTAGRLQVGSSSDDVTAAGVLDPTQFIVGSLSGTSVILNGTISRLAFWPRRLADSTLQEITR